MRRWRQQLGFRLGAKMSHVRCRLCAITQIIAVHEYAAMCVSHDASQANRTASSSVRSLGDSRQVARELPFSDA